MSSVKSSNIQPRIIIHGGAGNISRENLPPAACQLYRKSLLFVLNAASQRLRASGATALDVATFAVSLLEDNPLFNAGKGAVFTRAGTNELESSVMVSNGKNKRGVGCMLLKRVKNPIILAREMLLRGDTQGGGGAQGHCQLSGEYLEGLAEEWGLEMVTPDYFFTQKRWDEHRRGLKTEKRPYATISQFQNPFLDDGDHTQSDSKGQTIGDPSWDGKEYLPQGTVGAVVLDSFGTVCVATSTGGLTNKLPGRIGDTPSLGAGYWAEEWFEEIPRPQMPYALPRPSPLDNLLRGGCAALISDCLPLRQSRNPTSTSNNKPTYDKCSSRRHAVAMSGTGNGDSFLRVNAVRTAAAISRFSIPNVPLFKGVTEVAGPGGELQRSAGDRWGRTGEGEGGIIGIELVEKEGKIVADFNCGGMFRAWVDDTGNHRFMVFREKY